MISTFLRQRVGARARRLVSGGAANLFGVGQNLIVQLVSVPILSWALGLELYGIWLIIATVPFYFAMSDLGILTAAASEIGIRHARGDEAGALAIFQSTALFVLATCLGLVLLVAIAVAVTLELNLWSGDFAPHAGAVIFLAAWAASGMISLIPISGLRATGHYARGTSIEQAALLIESLSILLVAVQTRDLVWSAAAPFLLRIITILFACRELRRMRPELTWGIRHASKAELRRLFPSALGALTLPVAMAINLQVTILMVGAILGPMMVAILVPVRTAMRMVIQLAGVATRAAVPEMAAARGRADAVLQAKLWRLNRMIILFGLVPAALLLAIFGAPLVALWTGGRIDPPPIFVAIMAGSTIFHGAWYLEVVLLTATHEHRPLAWPVLAISLVAIIPTALLIAAWGLEGAATGLLIADLGLAILVWTRSRRRSEREAPIAGGACS